MKKRKGYSMINVPVETVAISKIISTEKIGGYFDWKTFKRVPETIVIFCEDGVYTWGDEDQVYKFTNFKLKLE